MNNKWKSVIVASLSLSISIVYFQLPAVSDYVLTMRGDAVPVVNSVDPLLEEIRMRAKELDTPAQNAKIDPVWKTIPGYNGIKVNVEASYEKMKETGQYDEKKLIYTQIKPTIHLEDLNPAPIYKAHQDKPVVSFLVNVAWGNEYLQQMLSVLKKHEVKATFFLEGKWTKNNQDMAKMIVEGGHEIGNHSYSHPNMKNLGPEATINELKKTNEIIEAVTGKKVRWFAPPSGSYSDSTVQIADQLQMGTIMWSVDTIDWQKPTPPVLIQRVMSKIHPGAFVLMHPTEASSKSLETLIVEIKKRNLRIVTVTESLKEERILHERVEKNE
ncbi:polysaccharide deacetylase family protein [Peribacillus acanthi]|uniref:polysaccharide deacetylase family protein n=1 Tax=Peribacillus acanthi TaxID=2171554 RepID=UPI003B835DD6